jgi:putative oxidoreductase
VQRLFSTFPGGWPGAGLVFLRAATAIPLVQFITGPLAHTAPLSPPLQFLAATGSALLIVGLWTPVAGLVMAVAELCLLWFHLSGASLQIVLAALGVALAMIGPGAWSVDAHLFGRKRVRFPQK